jgi:hypothetical protein
VPQPIPSNPAIDSNQIDEDEMSSMPFMPLIPSAGLIDIASLKELSSKVRRKSDMPITPVFQDEGAVPSAADPTLEPSMRAASPQSQLTGESDIDQQLPGVHPVPNGPDGQPDLGMVSQQKSDTSMHSGRPQRRSDMDMEMVPCMPITPVCQDKGVVSSAADTPYDPSMPSASPQSRITCESEIDQELPAMSPVPNQPDCQHNVGVVSPCTDKTCDTSMDCGQPQSEFGDELNIDHELTSLARNIPVSHGDVGIDPSLLFHEGWGLPNTMNAVGLPRAGIPMDEDGACLLSSVEDMEIPRQSSRGLEEGEEKEIHNRSSMGSKEDGDVLCVVSTEDVEGMQEQSTVNSEEEEMQGQSSALPEEDCSVPMEDGGDEVMTPVNNGVQRKCHVKTKLTPAFFVEETLQTVRGDMLLQNFFEEALKPTNEPLSSSLSKPNLRARDTVPHYKENSTTLPMKRRGRFDSQSGSDSDKDEPLHSLPTGLSETLKADPNREPETLKEFVRFLLFQIYVYFFIS